MILVRLERVNVALAIGALAVLSACGGDSQAAPESQRVIAKGGAV